MSNQEEFYPMPFFATLSVGDLEASTGWYVDVPGFRLVFNMPGPGGAPALSHLRWVKYADLLLVDGNPLEDITVIGGCDKWFDAPDRDGIETMRLIMKDGKIYKNELQPSP